MSYVNLIINPDKQEKILYPNKLISVGSYPAIFFSWENFDERTTNRWESWSRRNSDGIAGRRKGNKQNNDSNHTGMFNGTRPQRSVIPSGKRKCVQGCHFRLIERCTWPQCNHSCPKLHNPFTGEEMDFIELLKSFGLDMKSVANALGIDIQTLNSMDHDELLNLLTQRAN